MKKIIPIFIITALFITSCSTIKLYERGKKDKILNDSNYHTLAGVYNNSSQYNHHTAISILSSDTLNCHGVITIKLEPIDKKSIKANFLCNDTLIKTITIIGKYRRGYFKVNRKWNSSFPLGLIFWGLGDNIQYIGLTRLNDLVIIYSGSGVAFLIFLPIFNSGGQYDSEFKRIK